MLFMQYHVSTCNTLAATSVELKTDMITVALYTDTQQAERINPIHLDNRINLLIAIMERGKNFPNYIYR